MKSLKIRLELNNKQVRLARQHSGVARHAYNWGLATCQEAYQQKEKHPSAIDLHKRLVREVKSIYAWYYQVSKCAPQQALRDLSVAYQRFFSKQGRHPRFKKKGQKDSFYLEGRIVAKDGQVKLPRFGWVRTSENVAYEDIKNVRISRQSKYWFVSFRIPHTPVKTEKSYASVGVDLGIKTLATLSTGKVFSHRRPYKHYRRKLKIAQRVLSKRFVKARKQQSNNYYKQKDKVSQLHYKISCIRKETLHQLTTYLAKSHGKIVIEDLHVKGMVKNHRLASAVLDGGFYEFKRQLTYKCAWYGSELIVADRWYASSKLCAQCGYKKDKLQLSERTYHCQKCKVSIDRDYNASLNLAQLAESCSVSACGGRNKLDTTVSSVPRSKKQTANSTFV